MKIKLVKDEEVLHRKSEEVKFPLSKDDKSIIDKLKYILEYIMSKAQGCSAIQIGVAKRIAVLRLDDKVFVLINPEVIKKSIINQASKESCISIDKEVGYHDYYHVRRPIKGLIKYYDEEGDEHLWRANKHDIRVFCHEIDHMNGVLITDNGKFYKTVKIT